MTTENPNTSDALHAVVDTLLLIADAAPPAPVADAAPPAPVAAPVEAAPAPAVAPKHKPEHTILSSSDHARPRPYTETLANGSTITYN
jgi:hypothetical protein